MTTAPKFTKGQIIKLTEELEIPLANDYTATLPVGTEVTVTEAFEDADYWATYGAVNMDISYAEDVYVQNMFDMSGQSDSEIYAEGTANICFKP